MDKLKIFSEEVHINQVCEEQLLYFGKISDSIINNNKTFVDITSGEINKIVEYTNVEECDFILHPFKVQFSSKIDSLIEKSERYRKKILLFHNDDDDRIFNFKNSIIFRTSLYKSKKPSNYFSLPAFCNNLNKDIQFKRVKSEIPTVGFCGALTNPIRKKTLEIINKTDLIKNFIIREKFWGGDIWGTKVREEYVTNIINSDFVVCTRGAGNFSYRFYEALCLGRIPLVINTDIDLPFDEFIDYGGILLIDDLNNIEKKVMDYWCSIQDYNQLQMQLQNFWIENLSPIGFIKNLNRYKNNIIRW